MQVHMAARSAGALSQNGAEFHRLAQWAAFPTFFLILLALAGGVRASAQDDDFLAAREAFRVGDGPRFERAAKSLAGYPLEPYIDYWRLKLRLENAGADEVQALLARLEGTPLADRLRADWLKVLGMKQRWDLFDAAYPQLVNSDTEIACYAQQSRLRVDAEAAIAAARAIWFNGREFAESCNTLFDLLARRSALSEDDVWGRIRLALEAGNTGIARRLVEYLPNGQAPEAKVWSGIAINAQAYLDKKAFNLKTRSGRETVMFAVHRLGRTSPQLAALQWTRLGDRFPEAERRYVWGLIATLGADRLDPAALGWFAKAGPLSDYQLARKARAALRAQSWADVHAAVESMSQKEAQQSAWRYWKARALKEQGRDAEAKALLAPLALEFDFYGQLAAEDLGAKREIPPVGHKPVREEVDAIGGLDGVRRALAFYRLELRFEGNREWNWSLRGFEDRQLLAAAEFARRHELYDRAIYAAERTTQLHDFSMRYLTPYREHVKNYAAQQALDEAWIYGLIRQESRFVPGARSSAGANGLMQLMPATAKWVASKMGLPNYRWSQTSDIETNISLGTWYLRHVLDSLDNYPLLASAAYNAGPGRARAWRSDTAMEGAVYAETIPFNETRDYVKKVMSAASYYESPLGQAMRSLKERIGMIQPRQRGGDKPLEEPGN
jgi:soluble lytic murein transglycosylase